MCDDKLIKPNHKIYIQEFNYVDCNNNNSYLEL